MENIYATCVDINGYGVLITGDSGSGKSDLALRLIENKGAVLVSDDRTDLDNENGNLIASSAKNIEGLMEIRGIGILKMPFKSTTKVKLVVVSALKKNIERYPIETFFESQGVPVASIFLDLLEASAPDKVVVKLKSILAHDKQNT